MAPTRARAKPSKSSGSKSHKPGSSGSGGRSKSGSSSSSGKSSSRVSKPKSKPSSKLITGREVRAIPSSLSKTNKRKQRRVYTDKELGIKPLNKITPVGVRKPTSGKKKGKVYIDDAESMRRIFALVRAEKDKDVEGKVQRERQLEEVREARRIEMEKKEDARKAKLEETKDALRKPRKKSISDSNKSIEDRDAIAQAEKPRVKKTNTKRVSFA